MTASAIPSGAKVRVVGDVHGDATGFAYAIATDRFIVQLGDLDRPRAGQCRGVADDVRSGGDRARPVCAGEPRPEAGAGAGGRTRAGRAGGAGHDRSDGRCAEGADAAAGGRGTGLGTLRVGAVCARGVPYRDAGAAVAGTRIGSPAGAARPGVVRGADRADAAGRVSGTQPALGRPDSGRDDRVLRARPAQVTTDDPMCGHGALGGTAVFLDTGAGKGGHLSWIDLP